MKKTVIAFVIAMLQVIPALKAQTDSSRYKVMSFVPQYLINNGIRVDYELRIKNNSWLQLCPQFYLTEKGSQTNSGEDYNEVAGVGIFAYHKIYLNKTNPPFGAYFSYGFTYNYFNINFDETSNSITTDENAQINKFGADLIIGFQTTVSQRIVFDIYTGVGGRYSEYKYSGNTRPKYNDTYWDYGYTGNLMHLGFRIGIYF